VPHLIQFTAPRETVRLIFWSCCCLAIGGCTFWPDVHRQPRFHNPFPQLTRIAVLPFNNLSEEPTLNGDEWASAYGGELQAVPGFEVLPVGVVDNAWQAFRDQQQIAVDAYLDGPTFQRFAQYLGVDAVVVGAVTDFTPYYPPRAAFTVHWYAANPSFHPIPPGYGLPWGTPAEPEIPSWVRVEAEQALAREQLRTQTPVMIEPLTDAQAYPSGRTLGASPTIVADVAADPAPLPPGIDPNENIVEPFDSASMAYGMGELPTDWPDSGDIVPDSPSPTPPSPLPQVEPVLSQTRQFHGHDTRFTEQLASYFAVRDDGRFGGWQAYLQRSDDFIRFCCHLHITEMLEARGGRDETDLILRWPIGRYERQ
jgi:hypothetical protein